MKCPQCQHDNPDSQKFCGECGSRLILACPACQAVNPPTNKFCGDCGMALFGAPIAHEDHASRAVRAALAIQEGLVPLREDVRRTYGKELRMRIGINTGVVVVGAIGRDLRMDYTAVGDTTN